MGNFLRRQTGDQTSDRNWFDMQEQVSKLSERLGQVEQSPLTPAAGLGAASRGAFHGSAIGNRQRENVISLTVTHKTEVRVPRARIGALIIGQSQRGTAYVRVAGDGIFVGWIKADGGDKDGILLAVVPL